MIKSTTALKKFVSVAADKGMAPREYRGEIISAPLTALAEFIGNIECPPCRREMDDFTKSCLRV
jgi:hypothetical protein